MTVELWALGLVLVSSWIGALGPIYIKRGMDKFSFKIDMLIRNYNLMLGVIFYILGIGIFMFALKGGDLSILYPVVSVSYIWVCLFSVKMLGEKMNRKKWLGILTIMLGVVLISLGI